jgi:hypothetical protein
VLGRESKGKRQLSVYQSDSGLREPKGCLTALGAATGHHAIGLCWIQTATNGDFQLGQNGMSARGEMGTEPATSFR